MTTAASMAQVNVRMSPKLKSAGEESMSACGCTPTEVIRWVYQTFSEGREGISRLLREGTNARVQSGADAVAAGDEGALLLQRIEDRYRTLFATLELDPSALSSLSVISEDELDVRYWEGRDQERGLGDYAE